MREKIYIDPQIKFLSIGPSPLIECFNEYLNLEIVESFLIPKNFIFKKDVCTATEIMAKTRMVRY